MDTSQDNDRVSEPNITEDAGKIIKRYPQPCIENSVVEKMYDIIKRITVDGPIRNVEILSDENSMYTDLLLRATSLLLPFLGILHPRVTYYSYESNGCAYAYSYQPSNMPSQDNCEPNNLSPRLTQFKEGNEDVLLPEGWRLQSIINAVKNSYMNIRRRNDDSRNSLFIILVSLTMEAQNPDDWVVNNIPFDLIKEMGNEGNEFMLIFASPNSILVKQVGYHGNQHFEQYYEYGIQPMLEGMNSCLSNCTRHTSRIEASRRGAFMDMILSDRCLVNLVRNKIIVGKRNIDNEHYDGLEEMISSRCIDVFKSESICKIRGSTHLQMQQNYDSILLNSHGESKNPKFKTSSTWIKTQLSQTYDETEPNHDDIHEVDAENGKLFSRPIDFELSEYPESEVFLPESLYQDSIELESSSLEYNPDDKYMDYKLNSAYTRKGRNYQKLGNNDAKSGSSKKEKNSWLRLPGQQYL